MKILCVVGTRPEAIKMAPVIMALQQNPLVTVRILVTAQHRDLLDQALNLFAIKADIDLDIMQPNQSLTTLTARLLFALDEVLLAEKPEIVLAQGDTTTVMSIALACFYHKIPFGHIEAGLRTWNIQNPFPEEINRVIAGKLATWHFAPTEHARQNLLREGVAEAAITVTGNTGIDALFGVLNTNPMLSINLDPSMRLILVTAHRRENFGKPFEAICRALLILIEQNPRVQICYPLHPNPNISKVAKQLLGNHPRILLCKPLDYFPFVALMKRAYLILSDSGGVQEEAPALGIPVLVLRNETERPEAIEAGVVKLVGTNTDRIVSETQVLLDDEMAYRAMTNGIFLYGDGHAAERIVKICLQNKNM